MDYDAVVVGAGPGGTMTAKTLAESGASVLVVEKRPEIGVPVRCGEGTGIQGLKDLGIKPDPKFIANEIYGEYLYSPDGTKVDMRGEKPNGYVLERRMFDKHLGILAARAGATVRTR
ncbi:MAG: NAD(P)/FAD-dependent oxidoreductase, partial [Candidatus Hydrothermarchaeaceae archaeon]